MTEKGKFTLPAHLCPIPIEKRPGTEDHEHIWEHQDDYPHQGQHTVKCQKCPWTYIFEEYE